MEDKTKDKEVINNQQQARCSYCHSSDSEFIAYRKHDPTYSISRENFFAIHKCNNCGLLFSFPKPADKELKAFFQKEYHGVRSSRPIKDLLGRYPKKGLLTDISVITKRLLKKVLIKLSGSNSVIIEEIIKRYLSGSTPQKATVLEIGPGAAPALYLSSLGYNYIGVEPSEEIVDCFRRKGYRNIRHGFAENLSFIEDNCVNVVLSISTLVHISDLDKVISQCYRVLKPCGIILIIDSAANQENFGSYTNYCFSKRFLAQSVRGFRLMNYLCLDQQYRLRDKGPKMLAVLKKE